MKHILTLADDHNYETYQPINQSGLFIQLRTKHVKQNTINIKWKTYYNYKNKKRNIIIQIMKPVTLMSYIMITSKYVKHDVYMHILPVFLLTQIHVFINHTLYILIKIVILYICHLNFAS